MEVTIHLKDQLSLFFLVDLADLFFGNLVLDYFALLAGMASSVLFAYQS
jgi:hypothetical protein